MQKREITLPEPHAAQLSVINQAKRFNVLNCGRRWGKSVLGINLLSDTAINGHPAGYFAPTYKLLEGAFKETIDILNPLVSRKHDNQFIELETGGIIEFWSLDNPNAGRSRKYKRAVVDEAAFVKALWDAWTKSIRPTLTDLIGDAWFMSTPRGKNDFYKLYSRGTSGEANWQSWQMPTSTNPYLSLDEIEDAKRDLPESAFNQEYLAVFDDNAANPFGVKHIANCVKPISFQAPVCYGVDLAKSHDWTVIIGLDETGDICFFDRWQSDWSQTRERLIRIIGYSAAAIDSTGVGDPIVEDIQKACAQVQAFRFTSQSKQQLMEGLASAIQKNEISVIEGQVKDELESFEFEYGRTGVKYSAPDGMHDDCVCALALARFAFMKARVSNPSLMFYE